MPFIEVSQLPTAFAAAPNSFVSSLLQLKIRGACINHQWKIGVNESV